METPLIAKETRALLRNVHVPIDYNNQASYLELKDKILPFDFIAFRRDDNIISKAKSDENSIEAFNHCAIVITSEILPNFISDEGHEIALNPNHLYIFESNVIPQINELADKNIGVQIRDLEQLIPLYVTDSVTKVAWCRLINNPFARSEHDSDESLKERREGLKDTFTNFFNQYKGHICELDSIGLIVTSSPGDRPLTKFRNKVLALIDKFLRKLRLRKTTNNIPNKWEFCSELVASIYQTMGILPKDLAPKDILPVDFFGYNTEEISPLVELPVFFNKEISGKIELVELN